MEIRNGVPRRFDAEVPAAWREANGGRWFQHTDGYWYLRNFFNQTPWTAFGIAPSKPALPAGFVDVFGREPKPEDFPDSQLVYFEALERWKRDLGLFAEGGVPSWIMGTMLIRADNILEQYGVPWPKFYRFQLSAEDPRATGEWQARIDVPNSPYDWNGPAVLMLIYTHLGVSEYQQHVLQLGLDPTGGDKLKRHPGVPGQLWGEPVHGGGKK